MSRGTIRILYNTIAPPEIYDLVRSLAPPGVEIVFLQSGTDAERRELIADCEVVIVAAYPLRRDVIAAGKQLRFVHHQGVGYQDTVDADALRERGIPLAIAPEGTITSAAEHAVLLMLATARRLAYADAELRQGRWHVYSLRMVSRELGKLTIGFVGMGRIGQAVAERLRGFGCSGIYCDPVPLPAAREAELRLHRVEFKELLQLADLVTLHVPLTGETRRLIDRAALAAMKEGAILINMSRGGVVDEAALAEALASGRLLGAGLDVFETEPPRADHPLYAFPNVILTPHIAAGTRDALVEKLEAVFANIGRFYRGEPLRNQV